MLPIVAQVSFTAPQRLLSKLSIPIQRVFPHSEHSASTLDSTIKGTQECQVSAHTRRRRSFTAPAYRANLMVLVHPRGRSARRERGMDRCLGTRRGPW